MPGKFIYKVKPHDCFPPPPGEWACGEGSLWRCIHGTTWRYHNHDYEVMSQRKADRIIKRHQKEMGLI